MGGVLFMENAIYFLVSLGSIIISFSFKERSLAAKGLSLTGFVTIVIFIIKTIGSRGSCANLPLSETLLVATVVLLAMYALTSSFESFKIKKGDGL